MNLLTSCEEITKASWKKICYDKNTKNKNYQYFLSGLVFLLLKTLVPVFELLDRNALICSPVA